MTNPENVINNGVEFSKDNRPSSEAVSEGLKAFHERKRMKDEMFAEFAKPLIGDKAPSFQRGVELYKDAIFDPDSRITLKERAELFVKFCDFVGIKESKNSLTGEDGNPLEVNNNILVKFVGTKANDEEEENGDF